MGMHYRKKSVKREHSTIKGIIPLLEKVTEFHLVKSIIPGRIKPIIGNYPKPILEFKMYTQAGFKCSAKSDRSVQEVFIVTDCPDEVIYYMKTIGLLKP